MSKILNPTYWGEFGGCFTAEPLIRPLYELEQGFLKAKSDSNFIEQLNSLLKNYCGRPTPLSALKRLSKVSGGALLHLKREDLLHTGAHKINNAIGQALLAKKMRKTRIIAETGAGQHGVATATACALLNLECVIYMGAKDAARQSPNLKRMQLLGATVKLVNQGSQTLKDAINEANRDWIANLETTHYLIGSAIGPSPFPHIVHYFQSIISKEIKLQITENDLPEPKAVIACVGGGSNAIGAFSHFLENPQVRLIGVQAGGKEGRAAAPLINGKPGVLHGCHTMVLQSISGQILESHSIAPGLDYPSVGPEHSFLMRSKRAEYVSVSDKECLHAFQLLASTEGIIPALESAHAVAAGLSIAREYSVDDHVIINLSGRGDKDLDQALEAISKQEGSCNDK